MLWVSRESTLLVSASSKLTSEPNPRAVGSRVHAMLVVKETVSEFTGLPPYNGSFSSSSAQFSFAQPWKQLLGTRMGSEGGNPQKETTK